MASGTFTKRDLIQHVFDSRSSPAWSKQDEFTQICQDWIHDKFPAKSDEERKKFVKGFVIIMMRKFKGSNKERLLSTPKNKAYLDSVIFETLPAQRDEGIESDSTPPKVRKV